MLTGVILYAVWGFTPVYFKLFDGISPIEVTLQRAVWALLFLLLLVAIVGQTGQFLRVFRNPRLLAIMLLSAVLVSISWLLAAYTSLTDHVLAMSMGYFLTPLINMALGILVLRERVSSLQVVAIAVGVVGIGCLAASALSTLWMSMGIALIFGLYGLVRKLAPVGAMVGLAVETTLLLPAALLGMLWMHSSGGLNFGADINTSLLLMSTGVVLMVPLLAFGFVVRRVPMVMLGFMQFIAPIVQFTLALWLYNEPMSSAKWFSFILIWLALGIFSFDVVRSAHRNRIDALTV